MKSIFKRNMRVIVYVFISTLIITACTSILPVAKTNFNQAGILKKKGELIESIEKATAAIVVQKDYDKAKKFVYKNWDKSLPPTLAELSKIENTTVLKEADRKVYLYSQLDNIYSNLAQIELPLKHPKGKWSWTTPMIDYKSKLTQSKDYAFKLYFKTGSEMVDKSKLEDSYDVFGKTLNLYTPSEKKTEVKHSIAGVYSSYGDKYQNTKVIKKAIKSYRAYTFSLKLFSNQPAVVANRDNVAKLVSTLFLEKSEGLSKSNIVDSLKVAITSCDEAVRWNSRNKEAKALKKKIKLSIHKIYFAKAESEENINTVESLQESIKYYKLAMKWKSGDQVSRDRVTANKLKISEKYYQQGLALEKTDAGKEEIIKNYKLAQKWSPNYKDTKKRIYIAGIVDEIKKLEVNISDVHNENERTRSNVNATALMLGKASGGLDKVTYVSDKFRDVHSSIKTIVKTCKLLGGIPVVGTVATAAKTTVTTARKPIDEVVLVFGRIEKPVIIPSKKIINKSKNLVDSINLKMQVVSASLAITQKSIKYIRPCVYKVKNIDDVRQVERDIKNVNKNIVKFNREFIKLNNSVDGIKAVATTFNSYVNPINDIERGINSFNGPLKVIKAATKGISKVLKYKIGICPVCASTEEILNATTGAISGLLNEAMKPLKPLLKKLASKIPSIPGIDAFTKNVEGMKGEYSKLNREYNKAMSSYNKLAGYQKEIKKSYNSIVDKTGCGQKI